MMPTSIPKILILGAGFGGLTAATELEQLALEQKARVTLIDKNDCFAMGFNMQWALIGRRDFKDGERLYSSLKAKHITFVQAEVLNIDAKARVVKTNINTFSYDYLIIALGAELVPELIPGLKEAGFNLCDAESVKNLKQEIKKITGGTVVIAITSVPFKCPPAPYEYAFLFEEIFKNQGVRDKIRLILTTPEPQPMPVAGKLVGDQVKALFKKRGIEYITLQKPKQFNPANQAIIYESGMELHYDLLGYIPPHRAPKIAEISGLTNESGFIPVTLGTFATKEQNVFTVGDCAKIELPEGKPHPKAGVFAEKQARVVCQNIIAKIIGGRTASYSGHGICFVDTGYGEAAPAEVDLLNIDGPKATLFPASEDGVKVKLEFERKRLMKWFGN